MNDPQDEQGKDFSEFANARVPPRETSSRSGSLLRGCGIAFGIAFLLLAFVVGACFLS